MAPKRRSHLSDGYFTRDSPCLTFFSSYLQLVAFSAPCLVLVLFPSKFFSYFFLPTSVFPVVLILCLCELLCIFLFFSSVPGMKASALAQYMK